MGALLASISLSAVAAHGQDATWLSNAANNDYNGPPNWSTGSVPTGTASFGTSSQTNLSITASTTIGGWTFNTGASAYTFNMDLQTLIFNGAGILINGGSANITNSHGNIDFNNSSTAGSATIANDGGLLSFNNTSTAGSATITNNVSAIDHGMINFNNTSTAGSSTITNNANTFIDFSNTSTAGSAIITNNGSVTFSNNSTAGSAAITNNGTGTVDFSSSSGPTGNNQLSAGSIAGPGNFYLGANRLTVGSNNLSTAVSGVISDCGASGTACSNSSATGGSLNKVGTGTLTLSGTNTYTGATGILAGTLELDGSIVNSSAVVVNSGGTLSGIGTVMGTLLGTQINGTLAPGNPSNPTGTLNILGGNLMFQSAAVYMVSINGANASSTNVIGGSATLSGATVQIASGSVVQTGVRYTILTTTGSTAGMFNPTVTYGLDTGTLTYMNKNVYLTFSGPTNLTLLLPPGAPINVVNVANGIDNFINSGGTLPTLFFNLFNLSGAQLQTALTQLDGEAATDAEKGAFALMNQFLGLMLDPFVDGRFGAGGGPIGFAPDQQASFPPDIALAYASVLKAPPPSFDQRWTAWGSAFGASSTTSGNASVGSNNVTAADYGFAGGMDYHATPNTLYGFALAGGGTNWNLAQGLGTGRSDAFQAGVYGKSYWGPAYVAAALGFTNNWFSTNRTALGDDLTANFAGQSYGGRLEAGYRYGVTMGGTIVGATPYAAIQTQWFHTPTYSETDLAGGGLGLTYNAVTANDTRSELGARFDDPTLLNGMPLILRARFAWAHDWVTNPALDAVFQSLPGSSFVVNGAAPPKDSALASAGAQYFLTPAWSLTAKFDGEFASSSQTYGGTGTLRYTW